MKIFNRILSTFLAVLMLLSAFTVFTSVGVSAAEAVEETDFNTYTKTTVYKTPEEKLASMELMFSRSGYELYVDKISGEVATKDTRTGDILFSNPYDIAGTKKGSQDVKKQLMSQIIVQYEDVTTGKGDPLYSFKDAAMRDQIKVLKIKNGVRIEYSIGQEVTRKLVPRLISNESFTKYIQKPLEAAVDRGTLSKFNYVQFMSNYKFESLENKSGQKQKEKLLKEYPICEQMDIWVFLFNDSERSVNTCENIIKNFCDEYTFEQMDADHAETGYEEEIVQYPLFKMALEYSLTDKGVDVTMPCNGLRYDMAAYSLNNISILPYMGAGNSNNEGYTFFPDGAGELFDFNKLDIGNPTYISAQIYGADYAYHELNVATEKSQKVVRYPVYGIVSEEVLHTFSYDRTKLDSNGKPTTGSETVTETVSNTIVQYDKIEEYVNSYDGGAMLPGGVSTSKQQRGYVAIIKEGESLAKIETCHGGLTNDYNYIRNYFNPKPKDSYDVADSLSVSTSGKWTVVSERKYTGNITISYLMLTDEKAASLVDEEDYTYYETSWFGMAEAYRDYLVENGTLTKLTETDLEENIPLYMEVFGAVETQKQIATIPMDVMTPLTTFDNILTMYKELSAEGVKNINFKMTGFANGGLGNATVPASLKWEKNVGGASGFRALIDRANAINTIDGEHIGLYPDFDFAYVERNTLFDSTNLKKDAVKTIDNRYSSKRQYSSTSQAYVSFYQLAISPSRYSKFYTKLLKNYDDYELKSMSLGSLGSALNSDFDEDDPYNREDSKKFTVEAFSDIRNAGYSLMTENANAYTWGYVDHLLNVDLDSSRHIKASVSVPFIGVVLHGYVQFAGAPFNEEGDTDYAMLRALENGASLYFILSYQNTSELKEFVDLSQYYSVRYDIWKEDVISYYTELNGLLKDVQDKVIIDHDFLTGTRILDLDELEAELKEQLKDAADKETAAQQALITERLLKIANAWQTAENAVASITEIITEMEDLNRLIAANANQLDKKLPGLEAEVNDALLLMRDRYDKKGNKIEALPAAQATKDLVVYLNNLYALSSTVVENNALKMKLYDEGLALLESVADSVDLIRESDLSEKTKQDMISAIQTYYAQARKLFEDKAVKEAENNQMYITEGDEKYVVDKVIAALAVVKADDLEENESLLEACKDALFTKEDILAAGNITDEDTNDGPNDNTGDADDRFVSDNKQIVIVTYGDRNDKTQEKEAYKSFILNYNSYAVVVEYEGVTYTIPRGGYVVVYHD